MGRDAPTLRTLLLGIVAVAISLPTLVNSAPAAKISSRQINQLVEIVYAESPEVVTVVGGVSLGMRLPGQTPVNPLPAQIVRMLPAFANHAYVLLGDGRIAIIEPLDLEVIAIY